MRSRALGGTVAGVMLLVTVLVWPALPERIPTHWGISGEVDGWSNRWPGAFIMPAAGLALWLLLPVLRKLDPRRANYERFDETFWLVLNLLLVFFAVMHVLTLGAALGLVGDVTRWVVALLGLMMVVLGNYLPRVRSNWWMGVRTPWTLENERVWRETHRLAGRTFMAGGLVAMLAALLPPATRFWVGMGALMVGAMVPVVYSYVLWRREVKE
jgi:uncharacterized membrane protein